MLQNTPLISQYRLSDRYEHTEGRVFLSGTQALLRIVLDQAARDKRAGLNTAGFVSGYRGSPLGGVDLEFWRQKTLLKQAGISFEPAVNEDMAATTLIGTQQVETNPNRQVEGVFGLWYGKGMGVDRSGDALKHANAFGTSPHGGVLVVAGDDHGCVSSAYPHQSDPSFISFFMPILSPADVSEYMAFGEYGYALSRFSGLWVAFKAISETVESGRSVRLYPDRKFLVPEYIPPPQGLHYRWPDQPGPQVEGVLKHKIEAANAFVERNPIDKVIYGTPNARYGIVTTGKGHLDLMEALRLLGLGESECRSLGIDIYKVGLVWPLSKKPALEFVRNKEEVFVVEEKRGIIESQFKEYFYDWPGAKPRAMVGKTDEKLKELLPWTGELSPRQLAIILGPRLERIFPGQGFASRAKKIQADQSVNVQSDISIRTPYFCSGCPHNSSTKVPEGSKALAGIGCHVMSIWMDRETESLVQMGGEGVPWAAASRYFGNKHAFQNIGDGTWYHSGSMAIRQAIALKANITYKVLFNGAVAMTGGQPVDGPLSVHGIAQTSRAEGVERIAVVSDAPEKFDQAAFPNGTSFHHRSALDAVQRELREIKGVTVLIYEQLCATEKRRKRKRSQLDDPKRFAVINELVCEGCGDCSVASNCLSVEPIKTEFGTKRRINLTNCNKDFTCLEGHCPSFVTVENAARKIPKGVPVDIDAEIAKLTPPEITSLKSPYDLLITGVGGTGVVTIGALISMAAHLEGKGVSVLDFTGFAQKFGSVLSHVRLGNDPDAVHQVRIENASANAVLGCDIVTTLSPKAAATYSKDTRFVQNLAEFPTGELILNRDAEIGAAKQLQALIETLGKDKVDAFDANKASTRLLGDPVYSNVMMMGYAWQLGLIPLQADSILQAIELNGVAIDKNQQAFQLGRILTQNTSVLAEPETERDDNYDSLVARRMAFLAQYQNQAYAERYKEILGSLEKSGASEEHCKIAAKSLFKLMSYKDEYEVARLHSDTAFLASLTDKFEDGFKVKYHLAPSFMGWKKDAKGRAAKREFGPWIQHLFGLLRHGKILRGTPFDPFGYQHERREERNLIDWYQTLLAEYNENPSDDWAAILAAPMDIRGYGQVKLEAIEKTKEKVAELCTNLPK